MDMSIVIPVKDDIRIKECVKSIDEEVETVIVLNTPSDEVREYVESLDCTIEEIPENNLSRAYNVGIDASSSNNVLLMDSDCTFDPDTLRKLYGGLDKAPLSKGRVNFASSSLIGRVIALSREYHVSDIVNAYSPPLVFRKDIREAIGGHFFDEDLHWTEDHEFDQRVQRAGLKINYDPTATIQHGELTAKSDLRSAFRYGTGYFEGVKKGVTEPCFMYGGRKTIPQSIAYDLQRATALPVLFADVARKKGVLPAAFMSAWMVTFAAGYYAQGLFNIQGKDKK